MASWYYMMKNKSHGPVEKKQIIKSIETGFLGPLDLIYHEGENQWRKVIDYKEFQPLLKNNLLHVQKEWILLFQTGQEGHFRMDGPFSNFEVKKKVEEGKLKYTDYAWKSGMTEWYMISHLNQFNFKNKERITFPKNIPSFSLSLPENVTQVDNVMVQKKKQKQKLMEKNFSLKVDQNSSNQKSTTGLKEIKNFSEDQKKKSQSKPSLSAHLKNSSDVSSDQKSLKSQRGLKHLLFSFYSVFHSKLKKSKNKKVGLDEKINLKSPLKRSFGKSLKSFLLETRFLILFFSFSIVACTFYLVFQIHSPVNTVFNIASLEKVVGKFRFKEFKGVQKINQKGHSSYSSQNLEEKNESSKLESHSLKPEVQALVKDKRVIKGEEKARSLKAVFKRGEKKVFPPDFIVRVQNLSGLNPKLLIQSKNRALKNIEVRIHGKSGDTINDRGFYKRLTFMDRANVDLNLRQLNLKAGGYTAWIKGEGLTKKIIFFLGKKGEYKKQIRKKRKEISFFYLREKHKIFNLTLRLKELSVELIQNVSQPQFSLKRWESYFFSWKKRFSQTTFPEMGQISWKQAENFVYPKVWMDVKELKKIFLIKASEISSGKDRNFILSELRKIHTQFKEIHQDSRRLSIHP